MSISRPTDDHHWLALWLTLVGGALLTWGSWPGNADPATTMGAFMLGAGSVWLWLVA